MTVCVQLHSGALLVRAIVVNTCVAAAAIRQTTAPGQFEGSVVMPAGDQREQE